MEQGKKIIIASDHRGFDLKEYLKSVSKFSCDGVISHVSWVDVGAFSSERSDYPIFALQAIQKMHQEPIDGVVLLCGSGNGMGIAANRFKGVFACIVWNALVAKQAKEDDNCNVLVIPSDYIKKQDSIDILSCWLCSEFKGGRYADRLALIDTFK